MNKRDNKKRSVMRTTTPEPLVVVLVGGLGTRLGEQTKDLPKPMLPIAGKPMLEHIVGHVRGCGFSRLLFKHYRYPDSIKNYFGNGARHGVSITHADFSKNLGNAGGLSFLQNEIAPILVVYGDIFTNIDLFSLLDFHKKRAADATLVVFETTHPEDSDILGLNGTRVTEMIHKPQSTAFGTLANAGLSIYEPYCFGEIPDNTMYEFDRDLAPTLVKKGFSVHAYKTRSDEYIEDAGVPERFSKVENDLLSGTLMLKMGLS